MLQKLIRPKFDEKVMNPLVAKIATVVPSPAVITLLALILGLLSAFALIEGYPAIALISLWFSGTLDTLDGAIARHLKKTSLGGAALDILSDRLVECALVLSLFAVSPIDRAVPSMLMMTSLFISTSCFLSVRIFSPKKISSGLVERLELFLFFTAMILLPGSFALLANLFTLMMTITAFSRLFQLILSEQK